MSISITLDQIVYLAPNIQPNYRGHGLLQLTGKESYEAATGFVKPLFPSCPNFETEPDAVICPPWCLVIATSEWVSKNCNAYADQDNIRLVTKAINGGLIGLAERTEWLKKTKAVWS